MNRRNFLLLCILSAVLNNTISAQTKPAPGGKTGNANSTNMQVDWYDLQKQHSPVLHGQGWSDELKGSYGRLPARAKDKVRPDVWSLSQQTAGLSVRFKTNSPEIRVRYQVSDSQSFPHMPATGVSGVDLYSIDQQGRSLWCGGGYAFKDTVTYTFKNLASFSAGPKNKEYHLYLPLYNHVKWMEIGLTADAELSWVTPEHEKPVVVYGTSIAQGGCASRPGMAWTGILERELRQPLINLGFSGNGRLEKEVIELISELDARLYILDCLPNLTGRTADEIEDLLIKAVNQIRTTRNTPILLVEHAGYSDGFVDKVKYESYTKANKASQKAFGKLKGQGVANIYYLSNLKINMPMDGMVDGVHPSDFGMLVYADAYEHIIRKILK